MWGPEAEGPCLRQFPEMPPPSDREAPCPGQDLSIPKAFLLGLPLEAILISGYLRPPSVCLPRLSGSFLGGKAIACGVGGGVFRVCVCFGMGAALCTIPHVPSIRVQRLNWIPAAMGWRGRGAWARKPAPWPLSSHESLNEAGTRLLSWSSKPSG